MDRRTDGRTDGRTTGRRTTDDRRTDGRRNDGRTKINKQNSYSSFASGGPNFGVCTTLGTRFLMNHRSRIWDHVTIILSNAEGDCLKSPLAWVILIDFDDRTSRRPDVRSFPPSAIRTANFSAEKNFGRKILGRIFFGRKIFARIFSWGGLGGRSRPNHFKKFAKANFLKWCRGGVWGPPRNLRYPCPAPVPCPRFTRTIYAYDLRVRFTNLRVRN